MSTAAAEATVPTTNINCWAYGEITTSGVVRKVQHEFHAIHQEIMGGGGGDGRHFVIAVAPIVVATALRCVQWVGLCRFSTRIRLFGFFVSGPPPPFLLLTNQHNGSFLGPKAQKPMRNL